MLPHNGPHGANVVTVFNASNDYKVTVHQCQSHITDRPTPYALVYIVTLFIFNRWRGGATGEAFELAISRSRVQILLEATLRNNLRKVVYTYVPLSPSSITWYRPKGGDALRLGR